MTPPYIAHVMEGRARLRHPALGDAAARDVARAMLVGEEGVREVRPGFESLLVLLEPGADFVGICSRLEQALPSLLRPATEVAEERRAARQAEREAQRQERTACSGDRRNLRGLSLRKLEVRALLGAAGLCAASGLLSPGRLHWFAGVVMTALATRHVWLRRKSL